MALQLKSKITDSFWFIPLVMCAVGLLAAQLMIVFDHWLVSQAIQVPFSSLGAEGGRGILMAVAGSVLGVAATSFSITTSVLATASSTFGPRLVRNFMSDSRNQFVLGSFSGLFIYSLVVLRSVRNAGDLGSMFVPSISINFALVLAVFNVILLIYFIHHIADSIQISTLISRVRDDLIRSIDSLYDLKKDDKPEVKHTEFTDALPSYESHKVCCESDGFVTWINYESIIAQAKEHNAVVKMLIQPGDYLYEGKAFAEVWQSGHYDKTERHWLLGEVRMAQTRTPYQDIRYAVQQPVDITIRALSPGINDPYTAINAIRGLSSGFARLARRENQESVLFDENGTPRVHRRTIAIEHMLSSAFRTLRGNVIRSIDATLATFELAEIILDSTERESYRNIVIREVHSIEEAFIDSTAPNADKQIIQNAARQITPKK